MANSFSDFVHFLRIVTSAAGGFLIRGIPSNLPKTLMQNVEHKSCQNKRTAWLCAKAARSIPLYSNQYAGEIMKAVKIDD